MNIVKRFTQEVWNFYCPNEIDPQYFSFKLSPAYELLKSRIHIDDKDFALKEGLIPVRMGRGNVAMQFQSLASHAVIQEKQMNGIFTLIVSKSDQVKKLVDASYLKERIQRSYLQSYQTRLNRLKNE